MNVSDALFAVFAGLFAVLLLASLAGAGLHLRVAGRGGSATIENLNARVRAWWGASQKTENKAR